MMAGIPPHTSATRLLAFKLGGTAGGLILAVWISSAAAC